MVTIMRYRTVLTAALLVAAAGASLAAQEWEPRRWRGHDGAHVRIGRNYHLPADQVAPTPVIVIGGSATIDGRIDDELVVIGGRVRIGPTAVIRGDVTAVGGGVEVADAAQVTGTIDDVSVLWPDVRFALRDWWWGIDRAWWAFFGFVGTLMRLTLLMLAACVMAAVAPRWLRAIEARAASAPIASPALGFVVQLLFIPVLIVTAAVLAITLIGIPLLLLLPFGLLAFAVVWLAGFAGIASQVGRGLRRSLGATVDSPVLDAAIGVWVVGALTLAGQIVGMVPFLGPVAAAVTTAGIIVEYLVWTAGLGAALTAPLRSTPPPLPAPVSASANA
jgi:hypothetical protein